MFSQFKRNCIKNKIEIYSMYKIKHTDQVSIQELSKIYKTIKAANPKTKWLDVLRKQTRKSVIDGHNSLVKKHNKIDQQLKKDDEDIDVEQEEMKMMMDDMKKQKGKLVKTRKKQPHQLKQLLSSLKQLNIKAQQYVVVTVQFYKRPSKHFTVTATNQNKIIEQLIEMSRDKTTSAFGAFSDAVQFMVEGAKIKSFNISTAQDFKTQQAQKFSKNINRKIYKKRSGGFFPFTHRIDNQYVEKLLEELQIYKDGIVPENPNICFIQAIQGQIPDDIIDKLKHSVRTEYLSLTTVKKICEQNNIYIKIRMDRSTSKQNIIHCGSQNCEFKADICCVEKHYFRYIENTGITSFFLKNYNKLKHLPDGHVYFKIGARTKDRFINSFVLVNELLKQKENLLSDAPYDLIKQFKTIEIDSEKVYDFNIDSCCRPISNLEKQPNTSKRIIFDCETYTNKSMKHIPYLLSCIDSDGVTKSFIGNYCFELFLDYLADKYGSVDFKSGEKLELYAHNSTYDGSFLMKKLFCLQILEKDSRYVSLKGSYHNRNSKKYVHLLVKDSYRLIPMRLSEIPGACCFKDQAIKEVMYYNMYNHKTIDTITKMNRKHMMKYICEYNENSHQHKINLMDKQQQFFDNLKTWNCENDDGTFDLMKYSQIYCEQDCKVLKLGLEKWYELFQEVDSRIDIYNFYSLPSLADYYFRINGCYDECFQVNGALGTFFQNFVVGGRVCLKNNKKRHIEGNIQDFDAVSLYPSAMHLFQGFLKGLPTRLQTTRYNDIKKYDGYFVKVKINNVAKKQPIPVLNYMDKESGTRDWTNKMVGKTVFLDKTGLEDAIEFQQIDFEILDGYYFNDGFNTKIKEQIEHIFNKRLEAKAAKNDGLQQVYKLLMNSSYGKLIQKTPDTDIKYIKREDLMQQVERHYNEIKCWNDVNRSQYIRMEQYKSLDESYSSPHLGCQILSYSKRLMNRVICLANDNNMNVYYTDTDSIHLNENDVQKLADKFEQKYGRKLIGKELGNFHCDFDFKGMTDIRSVGFIALGKKSYIDKLEGTDSNGEKQYTFHIRLKGISPDAIDDHVNHERKRNPHYNEMVLYERLFHGESITFNLNVNNRARFQKAKDQEYQTSTTEFKRTVKF